MLNKKRLSLAVGSVLLLGFGASSQAGVFTQSANLSTDFLIDGFDIFNPAVTYTDTTFSVSLDNLNGTASFDIPKEDTYSATLNGDVIIDVDADGTADLGGSFTDEPAGSSYLNFNSVLSTLLEFEFDSDSTVTTTVGSNTFTFTGDGDTGTNDFSGNFNVDYAGQSPLLALLGVSFLNQNGGSGSLLIDYAVNLDANSMVINIEETAINGWIGFTQAMAILDSSASGTPFGNDDGEIDGTATLDNVSVTLVPEPATLALLGLGVAGLGFARRRQAR